MSMKNPLPVVLIEHLVVDAETEGNMELKRLRVHFRINTDDLGLRAILKEWHEAVVEPHQWRLGIGEVAHTLVDAARRRLSIPSTMLGGHSVEAIPRLSHIAYQVDVPEQEGSVVLSGSFRWPGTQQHAGEIHLIVRSSDFTPEQRSVFARFEPWAGDEARAFIQRQIDRVLADRPHLQIFLKRNPVVISYKAGEGDVLAEKLYHRFRRTEIITPIMDKYDLAAEPMLSQFPAWINSSKGMVPVITPLYEHGTTSELEMDHGIRRARKDPKFALVPALASAKPEGFLADWPYVDFREYVGSGKEDLFETRFEELRVKMINKWYGLA